LVRRTRSPESVLKGNIGFHNWAWGGGGWSWGEPKKDGHHTSVERDQEKKASWGDKVGGDENKNPRKFKCGQPKKKVKRDRNTHGKHENMGKTLWVWCGANRTTNWSVGREWQKTR